MPLDRAPDSKDIMKVNVSWIRWGSRIGAILAALFVLGVILPEVSLGVAAPLVAVIWIFILAACVTLIFLATGKRSASGWLGWIVLVALVANIVRGGI
jgi:hypothetical protein